MTPDQLARAILGLSCKALWRPAEPVAPCEVALYELIYRARRASLRIAATK